MATSLSLSTYFPIAIEDVYQAYCTSEFWENRLLKTGNGSDELVHHLCHDEGVTIELRQLIPPSAMPNIARSLVSGDLEITRFINYGLPTDAGVFGTTNGQATVGMGTVSGTLSLIPAGARGCVESAEATTTVPIPLLGRKIEKTINDHLRAVFTDEAEFTIRWLE